MSISVLGALALWGWQAILGQQATDVAAFATALPTDVSGATRGSAAVGHDAAGAARLDAFELHVRQRREVHQGSGLLRARGTELGAWALYAAVPLPLQLRLFGGYEWASLPRVTASRSTLGMGLALSEMLYGGISYHGVCPLACPTSTAVWDAGVLLEPSQYVSLSTGIDNFNAAAGPGVHLPRLWRVGLAARPLHGTKRLTLAAETRLQGGYATPWRWAELRGNVDVMPSEGLHLTASYMQMPASRANVWVGLRLDLWGVRLWGGVRDNVVAQSNWQEAAALTVQVAPQESLWWPAAQTVALSVGDDLQPAASWWQPGKQIATLNLQLDALADDPTVQTVHLQVEQLNVGLASCDELRGGVQRLQSQGKQVVAALSSADDKTYMVAATADTLHLDPLSTLRLDGFAHTQHFVLGALEHLQLRVDAVSLGEYKTAADMFTRRTPRPADIEVQTALLNEAQQTLQDVLYEERGLSPQATTALLAQGLFDSQQALQLDLVDSLQPPIHFTAPASPDEMIAGPPSPQLLAPLPTSQGVSFASTQRPPQHWGPARLIQVVPVVGTMLPVHATNAAGSAALSVVEQLQAARQNSQVAGVVLRIDSPGGDVEAAEAIWRAVQDLAAQKPVVASFADVAASGGYYIAAPAHAILAQRNTVTGSIGIFTLKPDISGFLSWLGIAAHAYSSAPHANRAAWEQPLSEADKQLVAQHLQSYYDAFVARVAAGRHMSLARVQHLAAGRVYSGAQAQAVGLVDAMGGLADAVRLVKQLAHFDRYTPWRVVIPDKPLTWSPWVAALFGAQGPSNLWQQMAQTPSVATFLQLQALQDRPLALWTAGLSTAAKPSP